MKLHEIRRIEGKTLVTVEIDPGEERDFIKQLYDIKEASPLIKRLAKERIEQIDVQVETRTPEQRTPPIEIYPSPGSYTEFSAPPKNQDEELIIKDTETVTIMDASGEVIEENNIETAIAEEKVAVPSPVVFDWQRPKRGSKYDSSYVIKQVMKILEEEGVAMSASALHGKVVNAPSLPGFIAMLMHDDRLKRRMDKKWEILRVEDMTEAERAEYNRKHTDRWSQELGPEKRKVLEEDEKEQYPGFNKLERKPTKEE